MSSGKKKAPGGSYGTGIDMRLALFDFDGTISHKDSFLDFLIYAFGFPRLVLALFINSPTLILYMTGIIPNGKAKEKIFRYFFKGHNKNDFEATASDYAKERLPFIIRDTSLKKIEWHLSESHRVVVVTASAEEWLRSWCNEYNLDLIATKLEFAGNTLTGNIYGKNCHGEEKVRRIKERYPLDEYDYIYAYGDSKGDLDMMALADEKYYRGKKLAC